MEIKEQAMSQSRLEQAREMLALYIDAEKAILSGAQSYNIAGQSLTRAHLAEIRKGRQEQEAIIASLTGGRRNFRRVVPVDW